MKILSWALGLTLLTGAGVANAEEIVVKVDSRSGPWNTGINPKLPYGMPNARRAAIVVSPLMLPGRTVSITATGRTTTYGSDSYGPDGVPDWTRDIGSTLLPSYHMSKKDRAIHLNELVGAFVDADGKVVGKPFPIGSEAKIVVPDGASALSMGVNDDNYSDNTGSLVVTVQISEPKVTVEPIGDAPPP